MPSVLSKILVTKERWFRLGVFLHEPLKAAVLQVFHDPQYGGLPEDPIALYQELRSTKYYHKIKSLRKDNVINDKQLKLIFPSSKNETDSSKLDVTLLVVLEINLLKLPPPAKGWRSKKQPDHDQSVSAYIVRAREWRNFFHHVEPADIDRQAFDHQWNDGVKIVNGLGYVYDASALRNVILDPARTSVMLSLITFLNKEQDSMKKKIELNSDALQQLQPLLQKSDVLDSKLLLLREYIDENVEEQYESIDHLHMKFKSLFDAQGLLQRTVNEHVEFCDENFQRMNTIESEENPLKYVLTSVLSLTSALIQTNPQWKSLARHLGVPMEAIQRIDMSMGWMKLNEQPMDMCFQYLDNKVTWKNLKSGLQMINRLNIIDYLKANTLLTFGLQSAFMQLRRVYIEDLFNWIMVQPFMGHDGVVCDTFLREEAYVDLAIISAEEMDKYWCNSDREFHLQQRHFERKSIRMEEILNNEDEFVLIRGIAGIGKSTLVDTFVLKWAKEDIMSDTANTGNIDFLFKFTCRDLNILGGIKTPEDVLRLKYQSLFQYIDIDDLQEIAHRVLILVDGIDELRGVQDIDATTMIKDDFVRSVYEIINPKLDFLRGHKTLVAGRPEACRILKGAVKRFINVKTIEVCGFNPGSVNLYIEKFFGKDTHLTDSVKFKIAESDNLSAMASIPVYLWVICGIFKEDIDLDSPKTTTHLSAFACVIFLRNHLKALPSLNLVDCSLKELCRNEQLLKMIITLAKLSEITMAEKRVVFAEDVVMALDCPIQLEKSGFIVKHIYGERGSFYQFRHLVLQEFFTAVHLYLCSENILRDMENPSFKSCVPIVAGLSGIESSQQDDLIHDLIVSLREHHCLRTHTQGEGVALQVQSYLASCFAKCSRGDCLMVDDKCSELLSSFYEYHENLAKPPSIGSIEIKNIRYHHNIRNLLFMVDRLQITKIQDLCITNTDNKSLAKNFIQLVKLQMQCSADVSSKELSLRKAREMIVRTHTNTDTHQVIISLSQDVEKHRRFLVDLMTYVDQVKLHFSLDSLYSDVKEMMPQEVIASKVSYEEPKACFNTRSMPSLDQMAMLADMTQQLARTGHQLAFSNLELAGSDLTDEHIRMLKPVICRLSCLNISWNESLTPAATRYISDSLWEAFQSADQSVRLNVLRLFSCNLTDEHVKTLMPAVTVMEELDIKWNYDLSPNAMEYICQALLNRRNYNKQTKPRFSLKLSNCQLTDRHLQSLAACVCLLDELDISMNGLFSPISMKLLVPNSPHFNNKDNLRSLDLRCCDLTDEHVKYLWPLFPTLRKLQLDGNAKLTPIAMEWIASSIVQHVNYGMRCNLQLLSLKYIGFTDAHYQKLLPCLQYITEVAY